ncbi:hypothetical protein HMPREF0591_1710 [Mycobacterium parascrofulaceum ATCC BAA-614]|uniref:Uncharacterized protein n=1 Tax=Mycobacterium parascrofulaceum ATCC BAA-614 TaxID=525368 RepID=D5P6B6_9MYCO|nr:hypothetical protein HMPREF0591_1710 [Mycobacterium parascrofulaceum ATCC BAA-614]
MSYVPLMALRASQGLATSAAVGALVVSAALPALGSAAVVRFEVPIVVTSAGDRLVTAHYRFCNAVVGIEPLVGNFATGAIFGARLRRGHTEILWTAAFVVALLQYLRPIAFVPDSGHQTGIA